MIHVEAVQNRSQSWVPHTSHHQVQLSSSAEAAIPSGKGSASLGAIKDIDLVPLFLLDLGGG